MTITNVWILNGFFVIGKVYTRIPRFPDEICLASMRLMAQHTNVAPAQVAQTFQTVVSALYVYVIVPRIIWLATTCCIWLTTLDTSHTHCM